MKRWARWSIGLLAVAALGFGATRFIAARHDARSAAAATTKAPVELELAPADLFGVQRQELTRTL